VPRTRSQRLQMESRPKRFFYAGWHVREDSTDEKKRLDLEAGVRHLAPLKVSSLHVGRAEPSASDAYALPSHQSLGHEIRLPTRTKGLRACQSLSVCSAVAMHHLAMDVLRRALLY
jgi:hypothetical protein